MIPPPSNVEGLIASPKNSHTQTGAKSVSIIINNVISVEGKTLLPMPIRSLEIGVKIAPIKKIMLKEFVSGIAIRGRLKNAKKDATRPPEPIQANRSIVLYLSRTEKKEVNESTHKNA